MIRYIKKFLLNYYHSQLFYIIVLTIIGAFLCFFAIDRNSFTLDEVSTLEISRNWQSMWHILWTQEGNMWLYSLLMYFWIHLSTSEWIMRSFSAICSVMTISVLYLLTRNLLSEKIARIAIPLFITDLLFIYFAQTARGYSLALFLTTLSCYLFLKLTKNPSSRIYLIFYILVNILAIYTYLFAVFIIAVQYVALLFFPKKVSWGNMLFVAIGISICLLPLLFSSSFRGGHQLDWLAKPTFIQLPFGVIALAGDSFLFTSASCLVIAILLWKKKMVLLAKTHERFVLLWLLLWAGLPLVVVYVFSVTIKPIYQPQYFNTSLPAFILLISIGINELREKKRLTIALYTILLLLSFLRLFFWYSGSTQKELIFSNNNPWDWKKTGNYILKNGKATDGIIFFAYYIRNPFDYYFTPISTLNKPKVIEIAASSYPVGGGTALPEENTLLLRNLHINYPRLWLVLAYNNTSVQNRTDEWLEIEQELSSGYTISKDIYFNQIKIELLERKI